MLWTHNNELDRVSDLRGRQRQPGGTRQTKVMSLKLEWSYCWVHPAWDTMPPSLPRDGFSCLWAYADQLSTPLDTHATTVKCSWALSETLQRTMHQVDCFLEEKVMVHPWLQGFKVELCTRVLVHCSGWSPPLPPLPIPHWLSFPHTHTHRPWSGQASSSAPDLGWRIGKTDTAAGLCGVGQTIRLVCHIPQCWHSTYLHSITISPVVIQRGLRGPWLVPGFSSGLSDYIIPANKMGQRLLSGPKASYNHAAHLPMAKLSHSPEQSGCVWELSGAKLFGVLKNRTVAHAVSLTMFTCQCLVCEGPASSHPCLVLVTMPIGMWNFPYWHRFWILAWSIQCHQMADLYFHIGSRCCIPASLSSSAR